MNLIDYGTYKFLARKKHSEEFLHATRDYIFKKMQKGYTFLIDNINKILRDDDELLGHAFFGEFVCALWKTKDEKYIYWEVYGNVEDEKNSKKPWLIHTPGNVHTMAIFNFPEEIKNFLDYSIPLDQVLKAKIPLLQDITSQDDNQDENPPWTE